MTIIYHLGIIYNFKFNTKARRVKIGFAPPGDRFECGHVQIWPETLARLQAVQNVLASVVGLDIGAKTDYDASDPDVELKRACCHGGPTQANGLSVFRSILSMSS